jgi:hypothetical protein
VLWVLGLKIELALANPFVWWPIPLSPPGEASFVQMVAYCVYKANLVTMYFNLLPAFPLDGGRTLRGLLHGRLGRIRSTIVAANLGLVFAAGFLVWAFVAHRFILGLIAVFVGIQCVMTRRHARALAAAGLEEDEEEGGFMGYDFSMGHTSLERSLGADRREAKKLERQETKERERREKEAARERRVEDEVDRLLEKISRDGIDSLTRKERAFLEKASRRKR